MDTQCRDCESAVALEAAHVRLGRWECPSCGIINDIAGSDTSASRSKPKSLFVGVLVILFLLGGATEYIRAGNKREALESARRAETEYRRGARNAQSELAAARSAVDRIAAEKSTLIDQLAGCREGISVLAETVSVLNEYTDIASELATGPTLTRHVEQTASINQRLSALLPKARAASSRCDGTAV